MGNRIAKSTVHSFCSFYGWNFLFISVEIIGYWQEDKQEIEMPIGIKNFANIPYSISFNENGKNLFTDTDLLNL